ncbi:ABC transporter substrate-binding protein [Streptomyces alkaliterrae]|uniref:ABC transporter substrate-binding protein n=1 Tax=Streptomyces alkaliterrae TaxID=2213162 RepID=A0A5P0YUD7_9ACTN|nr:ABC transporter substrate-binding protein [Streptomyces alkaliterrae]MBB1260987.1 ABC transporter substrate-binding protein [Streptomyces alkaliterrae]MQS03898.1 ABC transporter substrate-binding protein [Streptomyces alkaliterrae]
MASASRTAVVRSLAVLASLTVLAGCGAQVTESEPDSGSDSAKGGGSHYPVTVTNCGEKKTFDKAPTRVVTNDVGITDIMFSLGLEDSMAGYVTPAYQRSDKQVPWADAYEKTKWLSKGRISKEIAVDNRADLVFAGWNYGFNEADGFTPATLEKLGIDSYLLSESCRNGKGKARGVMSPLDALYTDLENLGKIFDVEDRAEKLVADFRRVVADTEAKAPRGKDRPRVFLYDDGKDKPFTSGRFAGPHDIITKAGGDHIMKDLDDSWVTVGWETVVDRDPEIIVINNYGDVSAEQKRKFLKSFGPLKNVSAIRNDRIFVLDYVDLVESPRNPAAVASLGEYVRKVADGE